MNYNQLKILLSEEELKALYAEMKEELEGKKYEEKDNVTEEEEVWQEIEEEGKELAKSQNISLAKAIDKVLVENKELNKRYTNAIRR